MDEKLIDPVCGMEVDPHQHALMHEGIRYAFCSPQCRERFKLNPHLYIGFPGQRAPRQEGKQVIKQRRFRTEAALETDEAEQLQKALSSMMGVLDVQVENDTVVVSYDLLQATAAQLETRLAEIGLKLGGTWAERLRTAFVHYLEEVEVSSLEVHHDRYHSHG